MNRIFTLPLVLVAAWASIAHSKTAEQFLEAAPAPVFRSGHSLLPLTRWGWPLSVEANIELAKRWGYALHIDPGRVGEALDDPTSIASRVIAFNNASAIRYPVWVQTRRAMLSEWDVTTKLLSSGAWCRKPDGSLVLRDGRPVLKPYLTEADANALGQTEVTRLKRLRDLGVEVDVVLNGAEYMPGVLGQEERYWRMDPEVNSWLESLRLLPPADRVAAFATNKAKQERAVRDAVLDVMPRSAVIYYTTGDAKRGRLQDEAQIAWTWPFQYMIDGGTLPSWEFYFGYFGYWVPPKLDTSHYLVLHASNAAAQGISGGQPLSYNWVSAGWSLTDPSYVSSDKRYMGFLKFLYTLGSIGNVAGYFTYPPGGFAGDVGTTPPDWLRQIMLLSHVHATFSHLDDFLREGSLLPGDHAHPYSVDIYGKPTWPHPSYEFTTNEGNPTARVAARKLRDLDEWLIVAWAAAGADREIAVSIPELGSVTLFARAEGSLYQARKGSPPRLLDPTGMDPSRYIGEIRLDIVKPRAPENVTVN